ncbi:MAG: phage tail protein [Proteobacteria bacterium]|nr:phage tail protein [Pseudomonadota bacterium]MBU1736737.1 phage tail protein [Pseudomonadota bacterium]
MWSGTTVPGGWALCDGSVHGSVTTPNLVDRFILGAILSTVGDDPRNPQGSSTTVGHTLGLTEMPNHSHTSTYVGGGAPRMFDDGADGYADMSNIPNQTGYTGGNTNLETDPHSHMIDNYKPKYYALAYIKRGVKSSFDLW